MRGLAALALAALLPAALGGASATGQSLLTPICTGDGKIHTINTPLGQQGLPGGDPAACCAKGCPRKRAGGETDHAA